MKKIKARWNFPESISGEYDGFNESGIETFSGTRYRSLAREILQNSLDAATGDEMVTVEFQVIQVPRNQFPGFSDLSEAIGICSKERIVKGNQKAVEFFKNAEQILSRPKIPCLLIRDFGTTGLRGDVDDLDGQWFAITKGRGLSAGKSSTAGGSYGIGKNAPFTVSHLRTIFYSTRYKKNKKTIERALGKSILISQSRKDGGYTSGTGYYGIGEKCLPLEGKDIPEILRIEGGAAAQILVAGFSGRGGIENWQNRITAEVVANFFYAIDRGKLQVLIQGRSGDPLFIEKSTISDLFDDNRIANLDGVSEAKAYYDVCTGGYREHGMQLQHLGRSKLWARVEEGLPSKVALLRATGMLITDDQKGLKRWPGFSDFSAVCIVEGRDGNALLRGMENPQHNAFEPDRLEEDAKKGEKAIKELTEKIREKLRKIAMPETSKATELDELREYIPDQNPEETLPGEGDEHDLEGTPTYQPKPIKLKPQAPATIDDEGDEGGTSFGAGGGTGGGGGDGGDEGERRRTSLMNIGDVRVLHTSGDAKKKTVLFTPQESGDARIMLKIAGDGAVETLQIAQIHKGGQLVGNSTVVLKTKKGKRASVEVSLREPISDAIVLVASKE